MLNGLVSTVGIAADNDPVEGQMAPDFEITQADGTTFRLSDHRGEQAVYLVFWNTWCHYCMKKIPKLKSIQKEVKDQIRIVAINTSLDDSPQELLAFQERFAVNYALAFDHGKKVTDLYGVWGTPTEFVIDINGVIQHRDGVPDDTKAFLAGWNTVNAGNCLASVEDGQARETSTC